MQSMSKRSWGTFAGNVLFRIIDKSAQDANSGRVRAV